MHVDLYFAFFRAFLPSNGGFFSQILVEFSLNRIIAIHFTGSLTLSLKMCVCVSLFIWLVSSGIFCCVFFSLHLLLLLLLFYLVHRVVDSAKVLFGYRISFRISTVLTYTIVWYGICHEMLLLHHTNIYNGFYFHRPLDSLLHSSAILPMFNLIASTQIFIGCVLKKYPNIAETYWSNNKRLPKILFDKNRKSRHSIYILVCVLVLFFHLSLANGTQKIDMKTDGKSLLRVKKRNLFTNVLECEVENVVCVMLSPKLLNWKGNSPESHKYLVDKRRVLHQI